MYKVVDLFAGPGGLGEGFSSVLTGKGRRKFKIVLSVEKDKYSRETLKKYIIKKAGWPKCFNIHDQEEGKHV